MGAIGTVDSRSAPLGRALREGGRSAASVGIRRESGAARCRDANAVLVAGIVRDHAIYKPRPL